MFAPQPDGSSVTFWGDASRTAEELRERHSRDADGFVAFDQKVRAVASFLAYMNVATPPDISAPSIADAIGDSASGGVPIARRQARPRGDPGDADGRCGSAPGDVRGRGRPRSAVHTRSAVHGLRAVVRRHRGGVPERFGRHRRGAAGTATFARGGTGALAEALASAARAAGAEIRTEAEVTAIRSRAGRVVGVTLVDGTEVDATLVVSAADPKRTLELCDPIELGPTMVWRGNNIRQPGATGKVDLALSGLPAFHEDPERLRGRIVIGPSIDYVERASDARKYGHLAEEPWIEATIPSLTDPSLAPEGRHVMSALVQAAPRHLRDGDWTTERERLGDVTIKTLERYAPGFGELVEARRILTPEDLGDRLRAHRRPRPARRTRPRPVLRVASAERGGALPVRPRRSVPRGVGSASRRGRDGGSRRQRRAADPQGSRSPADPMIRRTTRLPVS